MTQSTWLRIGVAVVFVIGVVLVVFGQQANAPESSAGLVPLPTVTSDVAIIPTATVAPPSPTATESPTDSPTESPTPHATQTPSPAPSATPRPLLPSPAVAPPSHDESVSEPVEEISTPTPEPPTLTPTPEPPIPTPTPEPPPIPSSIPVLMYHYVRTVNQYEDSLGYSLSVTPELFDLQMGWLAENGYTPVRMDTMIDCLAGNRPCPERPVALTFDDGYEDAYTDALPILERYGFTATFYIVTNFVGQPGYMSWEQIAALRDAGMEIGSHTVSHPDLRTLGREEALKEITMSRAIIQGALNVPVESFCYPIGGYNQEIAAIVAEAGYTNAVTTVGGRGMISPFEIPRWRIIGGESLDAFAWYVTVVY